jgi:hypothetical protein
MFHVKRLWRTLATPASSAAPERHNDAEARTDRAALGELAVLANNGQNADVSDYRQRDSANHG